ncbi:MAG: FecR family protein [Verrucomicrobiota bacterium]
MSRDIDAWINGYLDHSLSTDEEKDLADWIKADPANAKRFAMATMLHDRLHSEIQAAAEDESFRGEKVVRFPAARHLGRRWLQAAAAMALLVGAAWWFVGRSPQSSIGDDFATLVQSIDAEFTAGVALTDGQRLGAQTVDLKAGIVRLVFDSGVEVNLEGPAQYELFEDDRTRLASGRLTANVPPGAEGFRVATPTAEVTDLGTAFGIYLDPDGASHVSVFDGEVEVAEPETGEKRRLKEGEEVLVTASHTLTSTPFDAEPYRKLWPIHSGIFESSETFELAEPWPRRTSFNSSDDHIFIMPERHRHWLREPLDVNISEPGEVSSLDQFTPSTIPSNQVIRSFILQYSPETNSRPPRAKRMKGQITFDRPVLGIIVSRKELRASNDRFSRWRIGGQVRLDLEFSGRNWDDQVSLSEDRRTVTLELTAPHESADVLRIILDATPHRMARRNKRGRSI